MTNIFEITVKINDQKFDIDILEDKSVIGFAFIYAKLKQVVKISANEDIDFKTHDFKLFNYYQHVQSTNGVHIESFNHYIKHQSLIEIKLKPKEVIRGSDERLIPVITINDEDQDLSSHSSNSSHQISADKNNHIISKPNPVVTNDKRGQNSHRKPFDVPYLIERRKAVEDFHRIVLEINIGWNFVSDNYMSVWHKLSDKLRSKTIIIPANDCFLTFHTWVNYYALNYDKFDGKISQSSQEIFDLLKVVHTLDLRQLLRDTNQTLNKIERISKTDPSIEYFRKHLFNIYLQKLKEIDLEVIPQSCASNIIRNSTKNKVQESNNCISMSRTTKRKRDNTITRYLLPEGNTSSPKTQTISLRSNNRINESNESPVNTNHTKKVIHYSDYLKSRPKTVTKISENIQTIDSNPSKSVQRIEESYTQMNVNSDPRLRTESILYRKSLQRVEDNHIRSETH